VRLRLRRARGAGDDEQAERERPEECLQPADGVLALLEIVAEAGERRDGREGDRGEQRVEGQPVCSTRIGERGGHHQQGRKCSTSHGPVASPSGRTVLLCSRRPVSTGKGTEWRHSPGSATHRFASTRTTGSGSTSTRSSSTTR